MRSCQMAAVAQLVEPSVVVRVVVGSSPTSRPAIVKPKHKRVLAFTIAGECGISKKGAREARKDTPVSLRSAPSGPRL